MDVELLSRIQFAVTAGFHFLYPPLNIGLGLILVIMEGMYLKTKNPVYEQMTKFWVKIFGLAFAVGVATGIVMEFEFGTNWSNYSRYVGDVFGSALAAEGIFAFFLESGFLAILLFGWDKVKPGMHFFATIMVALGAHFSAIWIIVANSWMQTPAGYHIVEEAGRVRAEIVDFWALVFNPSTIDRLTHTLFASWQTAAWFIISVSAYYMIKKRHTVTSRTTMVIGLSVAMIASLGQLITGHSSADTLAHTQPSKMAVMEGHFETGPADLYILGWVNEEEENTVGIAIPGMLSWLLYGDSQTPVTGMDDAFQDLSDQMAAKGQELDPDYRPPVNFVFQSYHIMVALGMFFIGMSALGVILLFMKKLAQQTWLLWIFVFMVVLPHIANQLGWITAEVGRQPFVVYGEMLTRDGVSQVVTAGQVLGSLIGFTLVYLLLFAMFLYLLDSKIKHGPEDADVRVEGQRA